MQVRDAMTTRVIRVRPDTIVSEALRVMLENQVDGLPVVNDRNQVVGILTYADLLRQGRRHHPRAMDFFVFSLVYQEDDEEIAARLKRILAQPVKGLATRDVLTCAPEDDLADVAGLMVDHGIKRVPVVTDRGVLAGIISRGDIMRAIWKSYSASE